MFKGSKLTVSAVEAALLAGKLLKEAFGKPKAVYSKEGKKNLVTEYDLLSQKTIVSFLQRLFPSHSFLAEESSDFSYTPSEDITWVIDPLDGTVNFAYQIPIFTVSIAACQGPDVLSAVVFQPMTHELFVAEKGKGAFLNGKRLHVSKESNIEEAFLSTGFSYHLAEKASSCVEILSHFLYRGIPIRRLGSAALDLSYVAAGRFDAFWEEDLHPWDVAAGLLLVKEAGGAVSQYDGKTRSALERSSLLASNGLLQNQMLEILKRTPCN